MVAVAGWKRAYEAGVRGDAKEARQILVDTYKTNCSLREGAKRTRLALEDAGHVQVAQKLRIKREKARECARETRANLTQRLEATLHIDGDAMHREATRILQSDDSSKYELILALMFVTGRRPAELVATDVLPFAPVKSNRYAAVFSGQLKTPDPKPYVIPLLVPYPLVKSAFERLRSRLPRFGAGMSVTAIMQKYQSELNRVQRQHRVFSKLNRPYDLRGIYASVAQRNMTYDKSKPPSPLVVFARILGHQSLAHVQSYLTMTVDFKMRLPIGSWSEFFVR